MKKIFTLWYNNNKNKTVAERGMYYEACKNFIIYILQVLLNIKHNVRIIINLRDVVVGKMRYKVRDIDRAPSGHVEGLDKQFHFDIP